MTFHIPFQFHKHLVILPCLLPVIQTCTEPFGRFCMAVYSPDSPGIPEMECQLAGKFITFHFNGVLHNHVGDIRPRIIHILNAVCRFFPGKHTVITSSCGFPTSKSHPVPVIPDTEFLAGKLKSFPAGTIFLNEKTSQLLMVNSLYKFCSDME